MMDRGARTFYSPLKRVSMKQGGKVICTLLSTARANRVQSCSDLVCVRKITSSTNYSLGSMSGDAICKNRYTVRSVHLSEQGCTCTCMCIYRSQRPQPRLGPHNGYPLECRGAHRSQPGAGRKLRRRKKRCAYRSPHRQDAEAHAPARPSRRHDGR